MDELWRSSESGEKRSTCRRGERGRRFSPPIVIDAKRSSKELRTVIMSKAISRRDG
jgi:hypothetical protein